MRVWKWAQVEKLLSATRGASGENEFRHVASHRGRVGPACRACGGLACRRAIATGGSNSSGENGV